jgi:hypothetical protein
MTPQERDVITGIFERLKQAGDAPRDAEAERFIADLVARQPYAPYVMAQSVYVQEQAVANLHAQVEQLQAQLRDAEAEIARNVPQQSGGFLSGLFGGGAPIPPAQRPGGLPPQSSRFAPEQQAPQGGYAPQGAQPAAPAGPWGGQQQAPAGGGFLRTAATTAAGVAGGMMLGNVLMNAFGGGGQARAAAATDTSRLGDALNGGNADQSQTYDDGYQDAQQDAEFDRQQAADDAYQDAQQDASFDDDGGFDDGGDSWI